MGRPEEKDIYNNQERPLSTTSYREDGLFHTVCSEDNTLSIRDARDAMRLDSSGSSAAEAVALRCRFNATSFAWLPVRCFDAELVNEFLSLQNWRWFRDTEGREPVNLNSITTGSYDQLFMTQEYHLYHCTYMWRRMHRAVLNDLPLEGYIGSLRRTEHCEQQLVGRTRTQTEAGRLNDTSVSMFTKFVECPATRRPLHDYGRDRGHDHDRHRGW
ncbi:hypothetical protein A1O3_01446 [Capronia epimyces CBS 606.96]|uniref:Uncharacterized protein n=1 Tax=Capronia epimyces CBS 606.96 TaxID=1182542 RepID=W9YJ47_9EURO|nr:uncharacterized protein A1O3_01446 [Capronia epimyces CBS 606.96]EXJ92892.1 hypothetical protein A1O3_01446 [Capronia epimyces CBS 606.96]